MSLVHFIIALTFSSPAADLERTFTKAKARLGEKIIDIYIADTNARRARGLMFVEKLPADTGMLFVFDKTQTLGFWMKNTMIPLAIGFFDESCVLREFTEMAVAGSVLSLDLPTYHSLKPARFALEMNSGWFSSTDVTSAKLKILSPKGFTGPLASCK